MNSFISSRTQSPRSKHCDDNADTRTDCLPAQTHIGGRRPIRRRTHPRNQGGVGYSRAGQRVPAQHPSDLHHEGPAANGHGQDSPRSVEHQSYYLPTVQQVRWRKDPRNVGTCLRRPASTFRLLDGNRRDNGGGCQGRCLQRRKFQPHHRHAPRRSRPQGKEPVRLLAVSPRWPGSPP